MIQTNSNWNDKETVKKGNVGEEIVNRWLIEHGYIPYMPMQLGAHPFDRLCASRDKRTIFVAEVKSKPRRVYYPDTGIDERHLKDYQFITDKYKLDVFIFFVDEDLKQIYGGKLATLCQPREVEHAGRILNYPLNYKGIVYFPLVAMTKIADLDDKQAEQLQELSTRKAEYRAAT